MNSISSINSATSSSRTAAHQRFAQVAKNFHAIGTALQAGDVSSAQSALKSFQQAVQTNSQSSSQQTATNQPFGKNSQANGDYQTLTTALQSGNLSTAQQAFTSLQTDLKSAQSTQSAQKGHHHHHSSSETPATSSPTTTSSTVSSDGTLDAVA